MDSLLWKTIIISIISKSLCILIMEYIEIITGKNYVRNESLYNTTVQILHIINSCIKVIFLFNIAN